MDNVSPRGSTAGLVSARSVHAIVCTDKRAASEPFNLVWFGIWHRGAVEHFCREWRNRRIDAELLNHRDSYVMRRYDWLEYG